MIKRAYANKLKSLDLEKEPAAFQTLKEAFEIALKLAEIPERSTITQNQTETDTASNGLVEEELRGRFDLSEGNGGRDFENQEHLESDYPFLQVRISFKDSVLSFMQTNDYLTNLAKWQELLSSLEESSIEEFDESSRFIQELLAREYPYLSKAVLEKIIDYFNYQDLNSFATSLEFFESDFVKNYEEILHVPCLDTDFYSLIDPSKLREYLAFRYAIYLELQNIDVNIENVTSCYQQAQEIYAGDTDLISMYLMAILLTKERRSYILNEKSAISELILGKETANSLFVLQYIHSFQEKESSDQTINHLLLKKQGTVLSNYQYDFLKGFIFLFSKNYSRAYDTWIDLPNPYFEEVLPHLEKITLYLPIEAQKRVSGFSKIKDHDYVAPSTSSNDEERSISMNVIWVIFFILLVLLKLSSVSNNTQNYLKEKDIEIERKFKNDWQEKAKEKKASEKKEEYLKAFSFGQKNTQWLFAIAFFVEDGHIYQKLFFDKYATESSLENFEKNKSVILVNQVQSDEDLEIKNYRDRTLGNFALVRKKYGVPLALLKMSDNRSKLFDALIPEWGNITQEELDGKGELFEFSPYSILGPYNYSYKDIHGDHLLKYSAEVLNFLKVRTSEDGPFSEYDSLETTTTESGELAYILYNDPEEVQMIVVFNSEKITKVYGKDFSELTPEITQGFLDRGTKILRKKYD